MKISSLSSVYNVPLTSRRVNYASRDSFEMRQNKKEFVSVNQFCKNLSAKGGGNFNSLCIAALLKKSGCNAISKDAAANLYEIFLKERDSSAVMTALAKGFSKEIPGALQKEKYFENCSAFYNKRTPFGTPDILLASGFAQKSLTRPVSGDNLEAATFLMSFNKATDVPRKISPEDAIDVAFSVCDNKKRRTGTLNVEKLKAFARFYFGKDSKISVFDAMQLAELSEHDEKDTIYESRAEIISGLLNKKINGKRLTGGDVVKFSRHLFPLDIRDRFSANNILTTQFNTTTQGKRVDIDAVIEISKLKSMGYAAEVYSSFLDYFGIISKIETKRRPNLNSAKIASEIVRALPENLVQHPYVRLDIESLYKAYCNSGASPSFIAESVAGHFGEPAGRKNAEKEIREYLGFN